MNVSESGGPGAGGAWVVGCAGAAALVATVAAAITFCACRRRAANQRTRLHSEYTSFFLVSSLHLHMYFRIE